MATIKDVAKKAGVSISTASYAINNQPNVHPDTRERVLRVAEELNYYPNANARNLKTKKTGNIGVFIYGFAGPIFSDLLEGLNNGLQKKGYNIVVSSGKSSSIMLRERQIDAAVIFDDDISEEVIKNFAESSPIVLLDRSIEGENIYKTLIQNQQLVNEFMTEMIKKGYKKFAYLSGPEDSISNNERYLGFKNALETHNINHHQYIASDFTTSGGYQAGKQIAKLKDRPEFVYCANDESAIGLIKALNEAKIKIPSEIAVAGFDSISLSEYVTPKLSTIEINHMEWGKQIAGFLVRVLNKKNVYPLTNPEAKLIIRESV